jgi:ABC-type transport system involved in multi-copper enzyme maturation permease subunit
MIASLKAELQKIWTVRSTYLILLFSFVLMCIFAFWVEGIKAGESSKAVSDPAKLAALIRDAATNLAFWGGLVGILLVTHEYRYNTILYTLSSARRRGQVLIAKILIVSLFALVFTAIFCTLSPIFTQWGVQVAGHELAHQTASISDMMSRALFYGWGFSMLALLIASLIRVQPGAIAAMFLVPGIVEQLLGLVLKTNQGYLPFSSLDSILNHNRFSTMHEIVVALAWIVGGWLIAWVAFVRRDAN